MTPEPAKSDRLVPSCLISYKQVRARLQRLYDPAAVNPSQIVLRRHRCCELSEASKHPPVVSLIESEIGTV